jgi:hypothetical protein
VKENVNVADILADLEAQRERIDRAIAALAKGSNGRTHYGGRRRRKPLSAAARKRISDAQKKRWALRRKQR